MVKTYYYLIRAKKITNISEVTPSYRDAVTEYIAGYGYGVAEDGTIVKTETTK